MTPNSFAELALAYLLHSSLCFAVAYALSRLGSQRSRGLVWHMAALIGLLAATLPSWIDTRLIANPFGLRAWSLNSVHQASLVPELDFRFCTASALRWAWGVGVLWSGLRFMGAIYRARKLLRTRTPIACERVLRIARACQQSAGMPRKLLLTQCVGIQSPLALGLREICLPTQVVAQLTDTELAAVIGHELTHLKRLDPITTPILEALGCVLWFQPLWRFYLKQREASIEEHCDLAGARICGRSKAMAAALVKLAKESQRHVGLVGLANQPGPLTARVAILLSQG